MKWKKLCEFFSRPKEKLEITIETKESWEINWFRQSKAEKCLICQAETIFVSANLSAQIIRVEKSLFEYHLLSGEVHFRDSLENEKMICLFPLKKTMEDYSMKIVETERLPGRPEQ